MDGRTDRERVGYTGKTRNSTV